MTLFFLDEAARRRGETFGCPVGRGTRPDTPTFASRDAWLAARQLDSGLDWRLAAACRDHKQPDWWFPEKGESPLNAIAVCARCPVREECLAHALKTGEQYGIWGGLTERQRHLAARGRNVKLLTEKAQPISIERGRRFRYTKQPIPAHLHGTINGYTNYRCRCESCCAAMRTYQRQQKAARRG